MKKEIKFLVSIKRKPLLAFLVFLSILANVVLVIMYMTKPGSFSRPATGAGAATGPRARNGLARRKLPLPLPQDVEKFGEPLDQAEYPVESSMEQTEERESEPTGPTAQDLAQMRAQPQTQMGGQARLGTVTQVGPRGGRAR